MADDIVRLQHRTGERGEELIGRAPELIRHYIEIRGIGLLHIPDLYGADAVRAERRVDLLCDLELWREDAEYEGRVAAAGQQQAPGERRPWPETKSGTG